MGEDPYALAWMALTAAALDDPKALEVTEQIVGRLQALAEPSRGELFWRLRANTPFFGWGRAGRFETTALAVQALAAHRHLWRPGSRKTKLVEEQIQQGLAFLLLNKDGSGTWASTQASLQTLRGLTAVMPPQTGQDETQVADLASPTLGGRPLVPSPKTTPGEVGPRRWLLPLTAGDHTLKLPRLGTGPWTLVQTRLHHVLPWPSETATSQDLHFTVRCPTTHLDIGQSTSCEVEILRLRERGLGMMIAEVGLPPGAEVDQVALRRAVEDRSIQHFEVWPGRLVLYVWPQAEGLTLRIPWRPRLALRAKGRPSRLYDYYNPDANVVLPPLAFEVRPVLDADDGLR